MRVLFLILGLYNLAVSGPVRASIPADRDAVLTALTEPLTLTSVTVSATGAYLAALKAEGQTLELCVWEVSASAEGCPALPLPGRSAAWMAWIGGDQLLVSERAPYGEPANLYLFHAARKTWRPLIAEGETRPRLLAPILVSALPDDPDQVLLQWEDPSGRGYPAVYAIQASTGRVRVKVSAWRPVVRWYASPAGTVSLGLGLKDGEDHLYARDAAGGWRSVRNSEFGTGPALIPIAVERGGKTALVLSSHASDTRALWRLSIGSGAFLDRVAGHERFDIAGAVLDPETDLLIGADLITDQPARILQPTRFEERANQVASAFGARSAVLVDGSRTGTTQLFRVHPTKGPSFGAIWQAGDLAPRRLAGPRTTSSPVIPSVKTTVAEIPVGGALLPMQVYLSEAEDTERDAAPLIMLVHGGPHERVHRGFDPLRAWLVHLGYRVLEPNFRGSAGFGERWRRAGHGDWGGIMQADLRAAMDWARASALAENGICAVGGSYGGYAAIMAALRDRSVVRCAASINGITDLPRRIERLETLRFPERSVPLLAGSLSASALKARSPLYRADQISRPTLLIVGLADRVVEPAQTLTLYDALRARQQPVSLQVLEGAGHRFRLPDDRRRVYRALEAFLLQHLPIEAVSDPLTPSP